MDPTSDPCSDLNASTPAIRPGADCRRSDRWILAKTKSVLSPSGQRRCKCGSKPFAIIIERVSRRFMRWPPLARETPKLLEFRWNRERYLIDYE